MACRVVFACSPWPQKLNLFPPMGTEQVFTPSLLCPHWAVSCIFELPQANGLLHLNTPWGASKRTSWSIIYLTAHWAVLLLLAQRRSFSAHWSFPDGVLGHGYLCIVECMSAPKILALPGMFALVNRIKMICNWASTHFQNVLSSMKTRISFS